MFLSKYFFAYLFQENSFPCSFSVDDDYVPKKGDIVSFKKMLMPPKNEKVMAVHIQLLHLAEGVKHESWEEAVEHDMEHRPSANNSVPLIHEIAENGDHIHHVPSVTHVD
jgi:hypothetical protein